jgi:hypothetical protein
MALSGEAVRLIEQDILLKADVLAHYIEGLASTDADRAQTVCAQVVARLKSALPTETRFEPRPEQRSSDDRPTLRVATRSSGSDETEDFILEILVHSPRGLSVQEIVDHFEEAGLELKRTALVVRLRRLVQAGKLTSRTHGHYVLSEAEHSRRQLA